MAAKLPHGYGWAAFQPPRNSRTSSCYLSLARGFAVFFGTFSLLNVGGSLWREHFDGSHWWIRLEAPAFLRDGLLLLASVFLIAFAFRPRMARRRRTVTVVLTNVLFVTAVANATTFYALAAQDAIYPGIRFPLSLLIALALAMIAWSLCPPLSDHSPRAVSEKPITSTRPQRPGVAATFIVAVCCGLAFPAGQMLFFGKTDYRRRADAAVVFGCRAYADGRPSDALSDRVRTACQLYLDGTVGKLIFSGGPGDGAVHETEAMRQMAIALGVKETDVMVDLHGLSTQATVENTIPLFREHDFKRVLAVSHFFHLPRIKMAYQRQGVEVYTVPARESYMLRQMPFLVARETAAWWVYYIRPLVAPEVVRG